MQDAATWSAVGIAAFGVAVAWRQLGNLNKTLRINGLMAALQMEAETNARKEKLNEIAGRINEEGLNDDPNTALLEILGNQLDASIENYLNSVDRLAYCILKGYLPDKDWRAEYRDAIANDVKTYESLLGPSTPYKNILDLNQKWQRE